MAKYRGTGKVASTDYKAVKWVGKSKSGEAVTIEIDKAINMGNIDWTFAEKGETVAAVEFTGVYSNTDSMADSTVEPWTMTVDGAPSGADAILLDAGAFFIGGTAVALTRGGGKFTVEREFREINADGDRGPVEGRVTIDRAVPKLSLNSLQIINRVVDLYAGVEAVTE